MTNYADIHKYEGIDSILKMLNVAKVMTGNVTSKTNQELEDDFVPFGLMDDLPFRVTADDTLKHKPNPEPILKFLEISGANKSEAIYIGDTVYIAIVLRLWTSLW